MYFEESFFEGEEREGFYVEPMMKRAWAAQLEVLQQIDDICRRHNIEYFADWGTLLGAIRHQGYIPWDDDLDIGMKRLDYERFLRIAPKELPKEYEVLTSVKYFDWNRKLARVVNTREIPVKKERLQQFHGFPYAAGIDIFPMDYIPIDKSEEDALFDLFSAVFNLALVWDVGQMDENMENLRGIEVCCNIKFTEDKPYKQQLWILVDRIAAMYYDIAADAKELTEMDRLVENPNFRVPVSCYQTMIRVPFENTTIPVPVGYEQILTVYFGEDYMIPKRGMTDHEYPFYKRQQKELFDRYKASGLEMPKYLLE